MKKMATKPKYQIGDFVKTTISDNDFWEITNMKWNGLTWMYFFKESDARMGEKYILSKYRL